MVDAYHIALEQFHMHRQYKAHDFYLATPPLNAQYNLEQVRVLAILFIKLLRRLRE